MRRRFTKNLGGDFREGGHVFVTTIWYVLLAVSCLTLNIYISSVWWFLRGNAQYFFPLVPIPTFRYILSHWIVSLIVFFFLFFFSYLWQPINSFLFLLPSVFRCFLFRFRCVFFSAYRFCEFFYPVFRTLCCANCPTINVV